MGAQNRNLVLKFPETKSFSLKIWISGQKCFDKENTFLQFSVSPIIFGGRRAIALCPLSHDTTASNSEIKKSCEKKNKIDV